MDRRVTIKWMLAAATPISLGGISSPAAQAGSSASREKSQPYGTDPNLQWKYHPGSLWPLTFNAGQRSLATILCDTIIPSDATSPSASAAGVVDFIDEWISAPYPIQRADRETVLQGFAWLGAEAARRFSKPIAAVTADQMRAICDDICYLPRAKPEFLAAAKFFTRYRDLTTGGFYSSPRGRSDLRYMGNTPLLRFDGPPAEVLRKVGLA